MIPLSYFASAGLMAYGGMKFITANLIRKANDKLEVAINEQLPLNDEVKFLAIRCLAQPLPVNSRIIPENSCFFWRATVKEHKTNVDIGIGPVLSEKTDLGVIVTPRQQEQSQMVGFPNPLIPICNIGTLAVHNLDLAEWKDSFQTKSAHWKPMAAASLLRSLGIKPNLSADHYHIVIDQFTEPEFTVFGAVTKSENGYSVDSRIVTRSTAEDYVAEKRYEEKKALKKGKLYGLGACIVGSATWTTAAQIDWFSQSWEMSRHSRFYRDIKIITYSRLGVGYAGLIGSVYAFQKVFNS